MPVLLIALLALAVFGVIGVLLLTAAVLETKTENKHNGAAHLQETAIAGGKRMTGWLLGDQARSHALEQRTKNRKNCERCLRPANRRQKPVLRHEAP